MSDSFLLLGLVGALGVLYLSMQNWRHSVKAILVLVVLEGAVRKWALPQASQFVYFLKDFILLGAYLRYFFFSKPLAFLPSKGPKELKPLLLLLVFWCIFQIFNPRLGSPVVGVFGLRGYLFYIPLLWMVPTLFSSRDELYRFLRLYILLVIPVGLLGIAQYFSSANSWINTYVSDLELDVATFGGGNTSVRITGTFSYLAGYGVYLLVSFAFLLPLLFSAQGLRWRLAIASAFVILMVNSFMNGSRGVVFGEAIIAAGFLGLQFLHRPRSVTKLAGRLLLPAILLIIAFSYFFPDAFNSFQDRTTRNSDIPGRVSLAYTQVFKFAQVVGMDGFGIGATHQAVPVLRSTLRLPRGAPINLYFEDEMGRVLLEIGIPGFILWYGLRITLIFLLWKCFRNLHDPFLRSLALSAFLLHLLQFQGQLVVQHTLLVYYWFTAAFIWLLPRLEKLDDIQTSHQFLAPGVNQPYYDAPLYYHNPSDR